MTILEKYIWVINALYNKGEHGLSLKELNDRWIRDINVSNGEPLHRQTFDRWKGNILMAFGVNIECNLKGGYRYYISNPESLNNGEIVSWLLDAYSTVNTLSQNIQLKSRIELEDIPSNRFDSHHRSNERQHGNFYNTQEFYAQEILYISC